MEPEELTKYVIDTFKLRTEDVAVRTGATNRTVDRWYRNGDKPQPYYQRVLRQLIEELKAEKKGQKK